MTEYCENEVFETYCEDMLDKAKVVHSVRNSRPHKTQMELSWKEIENMHGETKIYNLNKPIKWDEFNSMPDDLKIQYIKVLRQRYGVSDTKIGEMMGVAKQTISRVVVTLGIGHGLEGKRDKSKYDAAGWCEFVNGKSGKASLEIIANPEPVPTTIPRLPAQNATLAKGGSIEFEGTIDDVCRSMANIVGGGKYSFVIRFSRITEERNIQYDD